MKIRCSVLIFLLSLQPLLAQHRMVGPEMGEIQRDIKSINLINGLNLTIEQMVALKELTRETAHLEESTERDAERVEDRTLALMREFYESLERNEIPSERMKARVHRSEHPFKELRASFVEAMVEKVEQVKSVLNRGQLEMVKEYRPCIVPTQDLIDPSRIGSAASEKLKQRFDAIRSLSEDEFRRSRAGMIDRYLRRIRLRFPGKVDEEEEAHYYGDFLEKVRKMDEVDWELQGEEMIEGLKEDKERAFRPGRLERDKTDGFIRNFLLNPRMYEVYDERIRQGGMPEQKLPEEEKRNPWQYKGWRRFPNRRRRGR
mgnify:CR=1 FL=1